MPEPNAQQVTREYIFTLAEVKAALGIDGDTLVSVDLWRGLSPADEKSGKSHEGDTYRFVTSETRRADTKDEPNQ